MSAAIVESMYDVDCSFCIPSNDDGMFEDYTPIWPLRGALGDYVGLKISAGALCVGNIMTITTQHFLSFGHFGECMGKGVLRELGVEITAVRRYWEQRLDEDYIITEHADRGCIEHAHQQWFPAAKVGECMLSKLDFQEIEGLEVLADVPRPYYYLNYLGKHFVADNPNVRSQWVRMLVNSELARQEPGRDPNNYDWLTFDGSAYLEPTWNILMGG